MVKPLVVRIKKINFLVYSKIVRVRSDGFRLHLHPQHKNCEYVVPCRYMPLRVTGVGRMEPVVPERCDKPAKQPRRKMARVDSSLGCFFG